MFVTHTKHTKERIVMADNKSGYEIRLELMKEALSIVRDQWYNKKESMQSFKDGKYDYNELGNLPVDEALKIANTLYNEFVNKK
jgi:hypothetical protein